jgi:hypothetical protein
MTPGMGAKGVPVAVSDNGAADLPRVGRESEAAARGMQGAERVLLELLEADLRDGASAGVRSVLRIAGATASAQCFDHVIELVADGMSDGGKPRRRRTQRRARAASGPRPLGTRLTHA